MIRAFPRLVSCLAVAFTLPGSSQAQLHQSSGPQGDLHSDAVLDLGTVPAPQAAASLGVGIAQSGYGQDWQFASAKAMGASWVRIQCSWNSVEKQAEAPQNGPASERYVQDPGCIAALTSAAKYGLHVTDVAAFGPPFHQLLYATLASPASAGSASLKLNLAEGVNGATLSGIRPVYDYVCPVVLNDDGFAGRPYRCLRGISRNGGPPGTLITGVHVDDRTHATISLASALTQALPANVSSPGQCSMSPGSAVLTCQDGAFDPSWDGSVQVRVPHAGARGSDLTTYIVHVQSRTQLVLRRTASVPVSNVAIGANRMFAIGEILYPSTGTNKPDDPSVVAYSDYATFLAKDMASRGVAGDVEIWNEPPWKNDSWDFRPALYDFANTGPYKPNSTYSKGAAATENGTLFTSLVDRNHGNEPGSSPQAWSRDIPSTVFPGDPISGTNFGFAANLQHRQWPQGVTATWNGTSGNGGSSLLSNQMRAFSGEALLDPPHVVTRESFHPYGGPYANPEEGFMLPDCLQRAARQNGNIYPNGANCYVPGQRQTSNLMQSIEFNLVARFGDPNRGLGHSITETNNIPPGPGLEVEQARSNIRQFLDFSAVGISPIEFFQLWDGGHHDPTYSFVDYSGASAKPLPSYTAFAVLMKQINAITGRAAPAGPESKVVSYSGTYPLGAVHIAGGKAGSSSELLALWQFSAAPGFTGSISGNTLQVTSLTSGWNNLAPGELIGGGRIPPGTTISAMGTGSGGPGTYQISGPPLSVPSEGMYVNWFTLPKMTPGTAHIQVPAGHRVTAVTDIITGAKVNAGQQGQNLTVPVGDDPVSVLIEAQ